DFPKDRYGDIQAIFTHSALARHFPFDQKAGYKPFLHASNVYTIKHAAYENALKEMGISKATILNDPTVAEAFWKSLNIPQQTKLNEILVQLLADYDFRYFVDVTRLLKVKIPKEANDNLLRFF